MAPQGNGLSSSRMGSALRDGASPQQGMGRYIPICPWGGVRQSVRLLSPWGPVPATLCFGGGELWWAPRRGAAHLKSLHFLCRIRGQTRWVPWPGWGRGLVFSTGGWQWVTGWFGEPSHVSPGVWQSPQHPLHPPHPVPRQGISSPAELPKGHSYQAEPSFSESPWFRTGCHLPFEVSWQPDSSPLCSPSPRTKRRRRQISSPTGTRC